MKMVYVADDHEFVKKTFLQSSSTSVSVTRSKVQTGLTFHPSTEQFQDPLQYISSVYEDVGAYGMCCIVPPTEGWKVFDMLHLFVIDLFLLYCRFYKTGNKLTIV